jgi:hypothetical protein
MNYDQTTGILRAIIPPALAYAVAKGWITQSDVGDITAAIVAVGAAVWSVVNNRTGKVIGGPANSPGTQPGGAIGR